MEVKCSTGHTLGHLHNPKWRVKGFSWLVLPSSWKATQVVVAMAKLPGICGSAGRLLTSVIQTGNARSANLGVVTHKQQTGLADSAWAQSHKVAPLYTVYGMTPGTTRVSDQPDDQLEGPKDLICCTSSRAGENAWLKTYRLVKDAIPDM